MALTRDIAWEACLLEPHLDVEVERRLRRRFGRVALEVAYFGACPELAEPLAGLNTHLMQRVRLDHGLADMIGAVVSHDNACRYCYAATRMLLRLLGYREERIRSLEEDLLSGDFEPGERAAFEFSRRVSRANPLPSRRDFERLRAAGFDELAVKELAAHVCLNVFHNRLSTLAALPPQRHETLPDRWFMRLLRPLAAIFVRRMHRQVQAVALREDQKQGPFAVVVCALDGLPLAGDLRSFLDALWASDVLPARSKALAFGVVARGLGCAISEGEATRLALQAGVPAATISEALDHLAAPGLDAVESLVLPFVRETIWYQPEAIQPRSRLLRDALPRPQYVELLITVAAANMICRLSPAVVARA